MIFSECSAKNKYPWFAYSQGALLHVILIFLRHFSCLPLYYWLSNKGKNAPIKSRNYFLISFYCLWRIRKSRLCPPGMIWIILSGRGYCMLPWMICDIQPRRRQIKNNLYKTAWHLTCLRYIMFSFNFIPVVQPVLYLDSTFFPPLSLILPLCCCCM